MGRPRSTTKPTPPRAPRAQLAAVIVPGEWFTPADLRARISSKAVRSVIFSALRAWSSEGLLLEHGISHGAGREFLLPVGTVLPIRPPRPCALCGTVFEPPSPFRTRCDSCQGD